LVVAVAVRVVLVVVVQAVVAVLVQVVEAVATLVKVVVVVGNCWSGCCGCEEPICRAV